MNLRPTITCEPDGPYLVKDLENLRDANGKPIAGKHVTALCRCGGSASKPFCDGTHTRNGFSGARLADGSADRAERYTAGGLTIHDNRSVCAHAGTCTEGLAAVFRYGQEPWIDPAAGTVEAIIETIRKCPSGALRYTLDGAEGEDPKQAPTITVTKDGPYAVTHCAHPEGQAIARGAAPTRYTLCRCGASKNKPYCDGTHWSVGFKDDPQKGV